MAKINGNAGIEQAAIQVKAAGKTWTARLTAEGRYRVYVDRKSVWVGRTAEEVEELAAAKIEAALGVEPSTKMRAPRLPKVRRGADTSPITVRYDGNAYKVRWKRNPKLRAGGSWQARVLGVDIYCGTDRDEVPAKFRDGCREKLNVAIETATVAAGPRTLGQFVELEVKLVKEKTSSFKTMKKAGQCLSRWQGVPKAKWSQNWTRVTEGDEETMRKRSVEMGWAYPHWDTPIADVPASFWSDIANNLKLYKPSTRQTYASFARRVVDTAKRYGFDPPGAHVLDEDARGTRFTSHTTTDSSKSDGPPKHFTQAEVKRLLKQVDSIERSVFWKAWCLCALNGALEQADLVAMRWSQIEDGVYKGTRMKTGLARTFVLWKRTADALEALRLSYGVKNREPYIFISDRYLKPYAGYNRNGTCGSLIRTFRDTISKPSATYAEGRGQYAFRHTFAHMAQDWPQHKQHVINAVMGHQTTTNVQNIYRGNVTVEAVKSCCDFVESKLFDRKQK